MAGLQADGFKETGNFVSGWQKAKQIFDPTDYQQQDTYKKASSIGKIVGNLPTCELSTDEQTKGQSSLHLLCRDEFIAKCKELFTKFDTNHNGILTYDELAAQVENKDNKGEMAQVVAALYGTRKNLQTLSNDSPFLADIPDPKGVTLNDINKAEELIKQKEADKSNPYSVEAVNQFDIDKDGNLSKAELQVALQSNKLAKNEAELFKYYVDNDDPVDPVRVTDVLTYFTKNDMGDDTDKMLNRMDMILRRTYEAQTIGIPQLFADKSKDAREGVSMYGVSQGVLGDCYFMSQLAAVAQMSPQTMKDMVKENADGTYTVTFPGAKDEPITVNAITESERGLFAGAADHGMWSAVVEKAYGTYCGKHFWRRTPLNLSGGNLPEEGADGGGIRLAHLMHLLTGKETHQDWLACPVPLLHWLPVADPDAMTKAKLYATVGTDKEDKLPVVAWQKPWKQTAVPDVTNHVYSVLEFDPKGNDGGTLTLYNPWGHKEKISYDQFKKRFMSVAYQTEP